MNGMREVRRDERNLKWIEKRYKPEAWQQEHKTRREEKSEDYGRLQKWKNPGQYVKAETSKAQTYCQENDQSAQF